MAKKSYSDKLKDPRWQKKRLEIFKRDKFKCKLCGDEKTTLNVHHNVYFDYAEPWEYDNKDLVTLCEHCHYELEILKKEKDKPIQTTEVRIFKDDGWEGGDRIMWITYDYELIFRVYNSEDKFMCGYRHVDYYAIRNISKIINKASNGI